MKSFTKTITYTPVWIHKDFTMFTKEYIQIRSKLIHKLDTCFKCDRKFKLNEQIGLACFDKVGNTVLCQSCAEELL